MIAVLVDLAREDLFLYTLVVALPSIGLGMLFLGFAQLLFGEQETESLSERHARLDREAQAAARRASSARKSGQVRR